MGILESIFTVRKVLHLRWTFNSCATLCIISLLTKIPVNNKVALTGEIDLNGSIHKIGGLESKIDGGKNAGVKLILYPDQNQEDIEQIKKNNPGITTRY